MVIELTYVAGFDSEGREDVQFSPMWTSSIGRLGVVLGLALLFLTAVAPEARADRATEMKAREAFAAGRYEDALGLFAKLYAETLHPVYLRNIGRCHQKLRQPEKALDKFNEYLAKEKKISADERKEIDGYIKEMEALRDEQAKQAAPPPPANPPPPVMPLNQQPPPPPNYYVAQPPPPPPTTTTSGTLVAQPPPPEQGSPIYTKWWFWTGIGVIVVGGVVTAVLLAGGGTTRPECTASSGVCMGP
jgi:hypothetical protein